MFGLTDRVDKEASVYCVMNDRTRDILLNLVKNNVYTTGPNNNDDLKLRYITIIFLISS